MESVNIRHGRGRLRKRPGVLYAGTKYGMPLHEFYLDGKSIRPQIPESPNMMKPRRLRAFDRPAKDRIRSPIERFNA